jgi:hypothetical protein
LLERHFFEAADVADDGARHIRPQAAARERLPRLGCDGEIVRVLHADAMTLAQQRRHVLRDARHLAGRRRRDRDVGQFGEVEQLVDRREGHVHRVELIVARRRCHHPAAAGHHANNFERLLPQLDRPAHRVGVAEQLLRDERAEHDDAGPSRLLARREEPAGREGPRSADRGQLDVAAVQPGKPARVARGGVHVLVNPFGDELHAAQAADGLRVRRRQRCRGAQARLGVTKTLPRRRMIVLLHRVVFRVKTGEQHHRS